MTVPTQSELRELADLVSGVARSAVVDSQALLDVAEAIRRSARDAARGAAGHSPRIAESSRTMLGLQDCFRALTHCVLLLRRETQRLQTIGRSNPPPDRSVPISNDV